MNNEEFELINQLDILCLCETWLATTKFYLPKALDIFDVISTPATREQSIGRPSGGLMIFLKRSVVTNIEVLSSTSWWMFIKVKINHESYIIVSVYWKPNVDSSIIDLFKQELTDLYLNNMNTKFIVGGDFNCRISSLNSFDEDVMFENSKLSGIRESYDKVLNKKGERLLKIMEDVGFIVCNGRFNKDLPARFTFIGKLGCSVIDLIWINSLLINACLEFEVKFVSAHSDHLLIVLYLDINVGNNVVDSSLYVSDRYNLLTKFNRNEANFFQFHGFVNESPSIYFHSDSTDELYENFVNIINMGMEKSGIIKSSIVDVTKKKTSNKPWFNGNCYRANKEVKECYKKAKKSHFIGDRLTDFLKAKQNFRKIINSSKTNYFETQKLKLNNISNSKDFWETIKSL